MDLGDVPRHRPLAFDKMESLIKEMQEPETGVPVRSQKLFLTFIPSAFMGYDLVEWLIDRFSMEDNEAINLANQMCQYGYFFPVNDSKNLTLKDDSSLYRFQSPYYWPWSAPRPVGGGGGSGGGAGPSPSPASLGASDNLEYAIYLVKRTLRNKQRHGLEEYELEALSNLRKNLAAKWDFITMQAEEQVRIAKDRKKGDKIVSDSQERAYWRVARPPPGFTSALEAGPVPARCRQPRPRKRTLHHLNKEVELLRASLDRTRVKASIALEALLAYADTFAPWDLFLCPPQPSNPWVTDDTIFWQINSPIVETPTEKRLQRWTVSMEELVSDPTGLQEFTAFLRKEYSHENIRFWLAVADLRRSSQRQVQRKLHDIYDEFLKPGAPCEINIDGATKERVAEALKTGSRFALDHAADHVYSLLLKKDCYPRFIRSEHFRILQAAGKNIQHKKRFFGFGGPVKKKSAGSSDARPAPGLGRRRGSDRSLSGSAHELAVCGTQAQVYTPQTHPPPHSHSQSNLTELPYSRETDDESAEVLPWESAPGPSRRRKDSVADSGSSSSDVSGVAGTSGERIRRLPQQSTLDGGLRGAPPPLRRLSAVEPRHLAPLCSPPQSPRTSRASTNNPPNVAALERTMTAPQPTPTISVSSAPDDESAESLAEASPEEATSSSRECADDPPSVFTPSQEPSPPETLQVTPEPDSLAAIDETINKLSSEDAGGPAVTVTVAVEGEPATTIRDSVSSKTDTPAQPTFKSIPSKSRETSSVTGIISTAIASLNIDDCKHPISSASISPTMPMQSSTLTSAPTLTTPTKPTIPESKPTRSVETAPTSEVRLPDPSTVILPSHVISEVSSISSGSNSKAATVGVSHAAPIGVSCETASTVSRISLEKVSQVPHVTTVSHIKSSTVCQMTAPTVSHTTLVTTQHMTTPSLSQVTTPSVSHVSHVPTTPVSHVATPTISQSTTSLSCASTSSASYATPSVSQEAIPIVIQVATPTISHTITTVSHVITSSTVSQSATVAPLAECEDVSDDNLDKVDGNSDKVDDGTDNSKKVPSVQGGELGVTREPQAQLHLVDNDNKGNTDDPSQRNDVCPWEDENSCETDAPFVKTYATLGYL